MSQRDTPVMDRAGWDAYPSLRRNLVDEREKRGVRWNTNSRRPNYKRHELDPDRDLTYGDDA